MEHVGEQQVDPDILDVDELVVGLFAIKLDEIGMEQLKRMRYLLPKVDYRRVKDRKAARDLRREKSLQMVQLNKINKALRKENDKLKKLFRERH